MMFGGLELFPPFSELADSISPNSVRFLRRGGDFESGNRMNFPGGGSPNSLAFRVGILGVGFMNVVVHHPAGKRDPLSLDRRFDGRQIAESVLKARSYFHNHVL